MKSGIAVVAAVLLALGFTGFANATEEGYEKQQALVLAVENGNKVVLRLEANGEVGPASLKGVMASWKGDEGACFTVNATQYLKDAILGKEVTIEWDSGEKKDKNGNFLVYISYGGVDINAAIIEQGHGLVPRMFPADRKEQYLALEQKAHYAPPRRGLWNACPKEFLDPLLLKLSM